MAFTVTELETSSDTTNINIYTTGSMSPATTGAPVFVGIGSYKGLPAPARTVASMSGMGLTWSAVVQGTSFGTGGSWRCEIWRGVGTASAGAVTITMSGQAGGLAWSFIQIAGADATGAFTQVASNDSAGSQAQAGSVTLGATPTGLVLGAAIHPVVNETIVPGSGFTAFTTGFASSATSFLFEYDDVTSSTIVAATWDTNATWGMTAAEIDAGAGTQTGAAAITGSGTIVATGTIVSNNTAPVLDYLDGFEHRSKDIGQFGAGSSRGIFDRQSNDAAVTFAAGRNSGWALRIPEDGVTAGGTYKGKDLVASQTRVVSVWFRMSGSPAIPAVDSVICSLRDGSGAAMSQFWVMTSGVIRSFMSNGSGVNGPVVTDGAWHRLDFWSDTTGTTWTNHWQVDGSAQTNTTNGGHVATDSVRLLYGSATVDHRAQVDFDDVVAGVDSSEYPYGDHRVVGAVPNVDGSHNLTNVTQAGGGALGTTAWTQLDEWPPDTTSYLQQTTANASAYAEVGFQDRISSRLWGVSIVLAGNSSGAAGNSATTVLVDSSGGSLVTVLSGNMGTTGLNYVNTYVPVPGNWDTYFNGIKLRAGFATDVAPQPRWQSAMAQYAFGPVTSAGTAVVAGAGTIAATGTLRKATSAATITGAGTIAAGGVVTTSGFTGAVWDSVDQEYDSATDYWDGAFDPPDTWIGAATLDGTGTIEGDGDRVAVVIDDGEADISDTGLIEATGVVIFVGASNIAGAGAISATGVQMSGHDTFTGEAAIAGSGELEADSLVATTAAASVTGTGAIAVSSSQRIRLSAGAITGEGTISATWRVTTATARFQALYRPVVRLEASHDPVIRLEASVLGVKSPIRASDDWVAGEDQDYEWQVKASATTEQDITGWSIEFRLANQEGGTAITTAKTATVTDATNGICEVDFQAADTAGLTPRTYWYELWRTDITHVQRLAWGPAVLKPGVS